jgi:uncharacterized protein YbaR (Trm112 family)
MDSALLAILACPKCRGSLNPVKQDDSEGLSCLACSLIYPIEEGIPVLLIEEGIAEAEWPRRSQHADSPPLNTPAAY